MFTIPEKKAVLLIVDVLISGLLAISALLATTLLSPYSGLALIPQAISIVGLGILLLAIGYLNETLDITSLHSDATFLKKWIQAWVIGFGVFATLYFFFGVTSEEGESVSVKITRFAPLIFAVLLLVLLPVGRFAVAG